MSRRVWRGSVWASGVPDIEFGAWRKDRAVNNVAKDIVRDAQLSAQVAVADPSSTGATQEPTSARREHVVYFLADERGNVKIGTSKPGKTLMHNLSRMQRGNADRLTYVGVYWCDRDACAGRPMAGSSNELRQRDELATKCLLERELHVQFKNWHVRGEWFRDLDGEIAGWIGSNNASCRISARPIKKQLYGSEPANDDECVRPATVAAVASARAAKHCSADGCFRVPRRGVSECVYHRDPLAQARARIKASAEARESTGRRR